MLRSPIMIRRFRSEDTDAIAQLFHDTVHTINARDYAPSQLAAWAPADIHFRDWGAFCRDRLTYVAEVNGAIAGFANFLPSGYLDCFYCHKDYQGQGVGRQLYTAIEQAARDLGGDRLFTHASITAQPFFLRMGFSVITAQTVTCRGETFTNYRMEKRL